MVLLIKIVKNCTCHATVVPYVLDTSRASHLVATKRNHSLNMNLYISHSQIINKNWITFLVYYSREDDMQTKMYYKSHSYNNVHKI